MTEIGFLGLGTMGGPMALNLIRGGYKLRVLDLDPKAVTRLAEAGAVVASGAAEVAQGAEVVITMLPDSLDVETAVLGAGGLAEGMKPGTIYIDMSTIDPTTTQRIGAVLSKQGITMIDSPVGKTAEHAVVGTLTLMLGGQDEALAKVEPILRCMGTDLFHCGSLGMGQVMKLTNNLLASVLIAASSEALVAGVKAGLTLETMTSVLRTTMAWNQQLAVAMHNRGLKGDFDPGFMVRLAHKDCRLAMEMNQGMGLSAPVGAAALEAMEEVMEAGMAGLDVGAILKLREEAAGVTVRLAK